MIHRRNKFRSILFYRESLFSRLAGGRGGHQLMTFDAPTFISLEYPTLELLEEFSEENDSETSCTAYACMRSGFEYSATEFQFG